MLGPLSARVAAVCRQVLDQLPEGEERSAVAEIADGLREPLRVAVAGPVNAGKSTLVNALLRQRVAPTDVSECTRVVAWYRYGVPERVEAVASDGSRTKLALDEGGRLPSRVRREGDPELDRLEVYLSNDALRDVVLIDTPGLSSANDEYSGATRELLALDSTSRVAVARADAVVFLLGDAGVSETTALEVFRSLSGGMQTSPLNAVGVLSKADTLAASAEEGLDAAERAAVAVAARLRGALAAVVPLLGLVAETVDTGALTDEDLSALDAIAALPEAARASLLLTPDRFVNASVEGVSPERRGQLLEALDVFGVEQALELVANGAATPTAVMDGLRRVSGIEPLRELLREAFTAQADVLKAGWALAGLERAAFSLDPVRDADIRRDLLDDLEALSLDPAMHRLAELRILQEVSSGRIELPARMVDEIRRISSSRDAATALELDPGADADAVRSASAAGVHRWKAFANDPRVNPQQRWAAEVVAKSYEQLWVGADGRT